MTTGKADQADQPALSMTPGASEHAFDFLYGTWHVHNRRLRPGDGTWSEFEATLEVEPLPGGAGNLGYIQAVIDGEPLLGFTPCLYQAETDEWSIGWSDNIRRTSSPPVIGRFHPDGSGEFHGPDEVDGEPVLCRFLWTGTRTDQPRCEEAFSWDGGGTWQTSWTMEHTRGS